VKWAVHLDLAERVAPTKSLRTLDALHLSTHLIARRHIEGLEILTEDRLLADAAGGVYLAPDSHPNPRNTRVGRQAVRNGSTAPNG